MKSKLKLAVITVLSVVMAVTFACFVGCSSDAENNRVDPPEKEAKVYSVALLYNDANVDSVLNVDLVLGEISLTAKVTQDNGADGYAVLTSSVESVAEISADGKILLKGAGETVIKATVEDACSKEIVLVVTGDASGRDTHSVTVVNGVADQTTATAGTVVRITPSIPEDKEILEWKFDKTILDVNGNSFVMPEGDVVISAVLVDKLASIEVVNQPKDNRVAYGNELKKDGLEIHAYSTVSGESWNVTEECEYELFEKDEYVLATYTLGSVKRTTQIPVTLVTEYVVSAAGIRKFNNANNNMNVAPEVIDGSYDKYKETGYIAGKGGNQPKFSYQNGIYCISNFIAESYVNFYFYSEFEVNARVTLRAASADYYNNVDSGTLPNGVYESFLAKKFTVRVNNAKATTAINPVAKVNAYEGTATTWNVCGQFSDSWLMDMRVIKGWNVIRLDCLEARAPNIEKITVSFTKEALTNFVDKVTTDLKYGKKLCRVDGVGDEQPTDANINTVLKGYEKNGAVFLDDDTNDGAKKLQFRQEGDYYSTACMNVSDVVVFYVYSEVNTVANIWINTASSASYKTLSTFPEPNGVYEVPFKDHFEIKLNGILKTPLDTAKAEAYKQDTPSWTVCQHFSKTMLFTASVRKGWNAISFKHTGTLLANLGDITLEYVYDND